MRFIFAISAILIAIGSNCFAMQIKCESLSTYDNPFNTEWPIAHTQILTFNSSTKTAEMRTWSFGYDMVEENHNQVDLINGTTACDEKVDTKAKCQIHEVNTIEQNGKYEFWFECSTKQSGSIELSNGQAVQTCTMKNGMTETDNYSFCRWSN